MVFRGNLRSLVNPVPTQTSMATACSNESGRTSTHSIARLFSSMNLCNESVSRHKGRLCGQRAKHEQDDPGISGEAPHLLRSRFAQEHGRLKLAQSKRIHSCATLPAKPATGLRRSASPHERRFQYSASPSHLQCQLARSSFNEYSTQSTRGGNFFEP